VAPGPFVSELLIVLAGGLFAGLICRRTGVPMLVGYLAIGALLGEGALGLVNAESHEIEVLAEVGVFLLLFSIGVEFSLEELLAIGRHILVGGAVQMLLVAAPVAMVLLAVDFSWATATVVASAIAFSSTVLVFKALSEYGQAATPRGRRAIGILLFQDAALVPLLLVIPAISGEGEAAGPAQFAALAAISAMFIAGVVVMRGVLARLVVPWLARYRSPELVVLFTLVLLGSVTVASFALGLSAVVGALAAGLMLGGNRWSAQIDALMFPFRETFSAVFFVSLGLLLDLRVVAAAPLLILCGMLAIIVLKGAAAAVALRLTGLHWRAAIGMGVGLAHIGEFALVLLLIAWEAELISTTANQRFVTIALGTLIFTPLLLRYGLRLAPADAHEAEKQAPEHGAIGSAVVIGMGPVGKAVASQLETQGRETCLVDRSPINLQPFTQFGFRTVAGDAAESKVLQAAGVDDCQMAVVCVPDDEIARQIVQQIRSRNPDCVICVRCRFQLSTPKLHSAGANFVVSEESQAAMQLVRKVADLAGS